jgi:hypothetical protein
VGRSVVKPLIRPERSEVSVDPRKSVAALNVASYRFADVKSQLENTDPVKSAEVRSTDVIVAPVKVDPLPMTVIVMDVTVTASKFAVAARVDVIVVVPSPFTVTVPTFAAVVMVATPVLPDVCVTVYVSELFVLISVAGIEMVLFKTYFV